MDSIQHHGADSPWVIPVRDLTRGAGVQRELTAEWPAPAGVSTPLLGIPEGDPVELDLRLESVHEGVLVTGTADAINAAIAGTALTYLGEPDANGAVVLTTTVNTHRPSGVDNEFVYEQAFGRRDQLEVSIPFAWMPGDHGLAGGLGDIAIGDKHVLYSHLHMPDTASVTEAAGSILSVQGEVVLATGDARRGLHALAAAEPDEHDDGVIREFREPEHGTDLQSDRAGPV